MTKVKMSEPVAFFYEWELEKNKKPYPDGIAVITVEQAEAYAKDMAKDYESVLADHRRLVRKLDILLNGDGAAEQASLCDIVSQVEREGKSLYSMSSASVRKIIKQEQEK